MTSYEVVQKLTQLQELLDDKSNVSNLIGLCFESEMTLGEQIDFLVSGGKKSESRTAAEIISYLVEVSAGLKKISSRQLYAELEALLKELVGFLEEESEIASQRGFLRLANSLEMLLERYETFIHNSTTFNALRLIRGGSDFESNLSIVQHFSHWTKVSLQPVVTAKPGYEELSIVMSYTTSYDEVVTKLSALGEIYTDRIWQFVDIGIR
jgi:hypothetical protein